MFYGGNEYSVKQDDLLFPQVTLFKCQRDSLCSTILMSQTLFTFTVAFLDFYLDPTK